MKQEKKTRLVMLFLAFILLLNLFVKYEKNIQKERLNGNTNVWNSSYEVLQLVASKIGLITNQTIRKQYLQNTGILYIKTSNNNEVTCNFTKFQEELENSN